MGTQASIFSLQTLKPLFLEPFGAAKRNFEVAWHGRRVQPQPESIQVSDCLIHAAVCVILLIPIVNAVVFAILKALDMANYTFDKKEDQGNTSLLVDPDEEGKENSEVGSTSHTSTFRFARMEDGSEYAYSSSEIKVSDEVVGSTEEYIELTEEPLKHNRKQKKPKVIDFNTGEEVIGQS